MFERGKKGGATIRIFADRPFDKAAGFIGPFLERQNNESSVIQTEKHAAGSSAAETISSLNTAPKRRYDPVETLPWN